MLVWSLGAAAASLLAHSGFGSPRAAFAHLAPLYLSVLAPLAIAVFIRRIAWRRAILLACAVTLVASAMLLAPEFVRPTGAKAAPGRPGQIKVIQLNALRDNADVGRVADWLISERPDIVTVSEARRDLRDLLVTRAGWRTAGGAGTLMIFTPAPYMRMERPRPARGDRLVFVNATYASSSGPIEIMTTHLDRRLGPSVAGQIIALESVVSQRPQDRMILTGDFNATPWSAEIRRLDRSLGLTRRDRALASWPAQVAGRAWPLPLMPIDHVYAGPGWATVSVERGPWLGSDHYPIIVTLAPVAR